MLADAVTDAERPYLLALHQIHGLGNRTLFKLLAHEGSPRDLWGASARVLKRYVPEGKFEALQTAWNAAKDRIEPERLAAAYEQAHVTLLVLGQPAYPSLLATIYNPPLILYLRGQASALQGRMLGVVGTRQISDYGGRIVGHVIRGLKPSGATIVSGLAYGVDACAHKIALDEQLPTVAVLGSGIDSITPHRNEPLGLRILEQGGAIVSEYPMGKQASRMTFPQRNRIIMGLSQSVLVVEGTQKSGALITAKLAMDEGRTVMTVPGNIFSPGSQGPMVLLKQGACLVADATDILDELHWHPPGTQPKKTPETVIPQTLPLEGLSDSASEPVASAMAPVMAPPQANDSPASQTERSPTETMVLNAIGYDPTPVEALHTKTGLPSAALNVALSTLELDGLIQSLPGAHVCRI